MNQKHTSDVGTRGPVLTEVQVPVQVMSSADVGQGAGLQGCSFFSDLLCSDLGDGGMK